MPVIDLYTLLLGHPAYISASDNAIWTWFDVGNFLVVFSLFHISFGRLFAYRYFELIKHFMFTISICRFTY